MDRFLCVCAIKRQQLQLLGATCLLIASKVRSSTLPVDLLCAYTDYSVTTEMLIVSIQIYHYFCSLFENNLKHFSITLYIISKCHSDQIRYQSVDIYYLSSFIHLFSTVLCTICLKYHTECFIDKSHCIKIITKYHFLTLQDAIIVTLRLKHFHSPVSFYV